MKRIIFPLALLLTLTACQSNEDQQKHDAVVAQQARAQLIKELRTKEEARKKAALEAKREAERNATKLEKIGIAVEGSKIIIDTNKTKTFFKQMTERLQKKMQKIQEELQRGTIEEQDAGIKVDKEKINIDLNKTKGFLESWGKKMQEIFKDLDEATKQIEPVVTPNGLDSSKK